MSIRNVLHALALSAAVLMLVACGSVSDSSDSAQFEALGTTIELSTDWAQPGDVVSAKISGANTKDASVEVAGIPASVTVVSGSQIDFIVPAGTPAGNQPVAVKLSAQTLLEDLNILGDDTVPNEFTLVVSPETTVEDLAAVLDPLSYEIVEGPRTLGAQNGVCSGNLVRITVAGMDTSEALAELKSRTDGGTIWHSDPQTDYSTGAVDHLGAIGADKSRLRGLTGAGTLIAVVDTGVSAHTELGDRLQLLDGHDFVDEGTLPTDAYPDGGHGTPIAVLAAGVTSGVAPEAKVLPVRVCDANGSCYTSDVLLGVCHALATSERRSEGMGNLVINLSLGGYTPIESIRSALQFALENGTLVAAAGGNERQSGSPRHYPAAYDLTGLVAVAALQASTTDELEGDWKPADFSNRGDYLDIAAPGVNLKSGDSSGGYTSGFSGTSFATGLTSGGLAVWRQAHPAMSTADIEAGMKSAAKPMSYSADEVGAGMLNLSTEPN